MAGNISGADVHWVGLQSSGAWADGKVSAASAHQVVKHSQALHRDFEGLFLAAWTSDQRGDAL